MSAAFVILPSDTAWRVRSPGATDDVRVVKDAGVAETARAAAAKLRERGYNGEGILVALPAAWCLAATISTAGLPRQERAAMTFRLEEKLPLAAESFTADFVPAADAADPAALGVCVPNERVRPLIDALESAGVVVQSVVPAALLAVQSLALPAGLVLWAEGDRVNLITLVDGAAAGWALSGADPGDLAVQFDLATLDLSSSAGVVACSLPEELLGVLADRGVDAADARDDAIDDAVARAAPAVLTGRLAPWVELRRGALGVSDQLRVVRRAINAALLAVAACLLVAAGVFVWRSLAYDRLAEAYDRETADAFRREFPGWAVPANVRAVVDAERRNLQAAGSSALPPEAQDSALRTLYQVLSKFPAEAKVTLNAAAFHDTSLSLSGKAADGEAVDVLVAAARATGMDVPPPQMRRDEKGLWDFTILGSRPARPAVAAGGGRE